MKKSIFGFSVRDMVEIALLCALAIVLDKFVKISIGATGGSINIAMFPLFIIALRHGPFKSLIAGGVIYGLISCLLDGYGFNTYPLEYFLAFGSVAILGFFGKEINRNLSFDNVKNSVRIYAILVLCIILCSVIRLIGATCDTLLIYNVDNEYTFFTALMYNASYIFPSSALVMLIMCVILPYIKVINNRFKTSYLTYEYK